MKIAIPTKLVASLLLIQLFSVNLFAQDENATEDDNSGVSYKGVEGFHIGFNLGAFFPNKDAAAIYEGYGFDANGNRNAPDQTYMYKKIIVENDYNSSNGNDRITIALGLNSRDYWKFDSVADMPTNLKYNTAFLLGLALHYGIDKKQAIIANLNFAKLTAIGNFNIQTRNTSNQIPSDWINNPFAIVGKEQRFMIQLGYSRILGNNEKYNFFIEGGLCTNNVKFQKNFIEINDLEIDLSTYDSNAPGGNAYFSEQYTGWGFGGFAGLGLNLTMNPKYTIQLLYSPSYETIKLGPEATAALQNAVGMRAYYNF